MVSRWGNYYDFWNQKGVFIIVLTETVECRNSIRHGEIMGYTGCPITLPLSLAFEQLKVVIRALAHVSRVIYKVFTY